MAPAAAAEVVEVEEVEEQRNLEWALEIGRAPYLPDVLCL
jgi:hypothetical protein